MSCGFLIAIAGHKRYAYPMATLMYHQVSSGAIGKAKDLEEDLIETKRLQKMLEKHTLDCTKIKKKKLKEVYKTKLDWFMTPKEAKELNVIDDVI
jgi:ATP-dependent Clp protease protease subunit